MAWARIQICSRGRFDERIRKEAPKPDNEHIQSSSSFTAEVKVRLERAENTEYAVLGTTESLSRDRG